jgi:RNase P/RNase MRP subunit p30
MKQILIEEENFDKARQKIRKSKGKIIIFSSNDDDLNRKIMEKEQINILLLRQKQRKDKLKQRNSGLNQVMAKIAQRNNISIGIDLDEIISEDSSSEKAKIIARIMQNIKLCNKNKVKMLFISQKHRREVHDLRSIGLTLGMSTRMTKRL